MKFRILDVVFAITSAMVFLACLLVSLNYFLDGNYLYAFYWGVGFIAFIFVTMRIVIVNMFLQQKVRTE